MGIGAADGAINGAEYFLLPPSGMGFGFDPSAPNGAINGADFVHPSPVFQAPTEYIPPQPIPFMDDGTAINGENWFPKAMGNGLEFQSETLSNIYEQMSSYSNFNGLDFFDRF